MCNFKITLGDVLSIASILIAIATFLITWFHDKKVVTKQALDELYNDYYDIKDKDINKNYVEYVAFLSKLDRFAHTIKNHGFMFSVVKKHTLFFTTIWEHGFMQKLIPDRRKQFHREDYYAILIQLLKRLGIKDVSI